MPLVPILAEPPVIDSNVVIEVQAPVSGGGTVGGGITLLTDYVGVDAMVEAPIEFVEGLAAAPRDRGDTTPEPAGTGPFGF